MAAHIVSYDLHAEGQNYSCLIEKIKSYGTYWHAQRSVWLIVSQQSSTQIRDNLSKCLDSNDKLFVAKLAGEAAWVGYAADVTEWLKRNL